MRHLILIQFAAASALTLAAIASASAHATLELAEAAPGGYKAVIRIPHGCDGQPTHTVRVEVPEGYVGVKPMPKPGWRLDVETGDYAGIHRLHGREVSSGTRAVTWSGGLLDDAHYDEFVLSGTLAAVEPGQVLFFHTRQTCAEGEVAWTEELAPGQNPHALARPAPMLTVAAAASGRHNHHEHGAAAADAVTVGTLEIASPWIRAMLPNQPAAGGYLVIANGGAEADRLVGGSSPAAGRVEIHTMEIIDDVMRMRPVVGGLEIPAGESVTLEPGGHHVMFMDVATPFREGDVVPVTLEFERAGAVQLDFAVRSAAPAGGQDQDHHHDHGADHGSLDDRGAIEQVLKATWEAPEMPLSIEPVAVVGEHAIAGWVQDGRGGRALLRKVHGSWRVHLCTGDAVKSADNLERMGVPAGVSGPLSAVLADAEAAMDQQIVALLSTFDGVLMMDEHGHH